jgi:putative ABC transport system permease protein
MRYCGLLFANLFRNRLRLALNIGSFAVALFLFSMLALVEQGFSGADVAGVDLLVVTNRTSIILPLPFSYRNRILRIPGVKTVSFYNWFGGIYQDEKNGFAQFAIDVDDDRKVFPELAVPDLEWQTFVKDRQGAIAGASIAKRFGWKIGQRIPIKGTIFPGNWEFNLDGIYHGTRTGDDETQFWFQWKYLEERLPAAKKGQVGWFTVQVDKPEDSSRIVRAIDNEFTNSPYETHTDSEKALAASLGKQMGNVGFLVLAIGAIVFFTLLLVTGNTMAMSVRERTGELAVLKASGYSDWFVMLLVLTESLMIAIVGGGLGLGAAKAFTEMSAMIPLKEAVSLSYLPWSVLLMGLGVALAIGAASGFFPAMRALKLRVVEALRRV